MVNRRVVYPAGLVATLLSLGILAQPGCGKRRPSPPQFDCAALQRRAERCEGEILELVRRRYQVEKVTAGATAEAAQQVFLRFKVRFQRKVRDRKLETECRALSYAQDRRHRKRASTLRFCFSRPSCRAFGECLLSR